MQGNQLSNQNEKYILGIQIGFVVVLILVNIAWNIFPSVELLLALFAILLLWRAKDRKLLFALLPFFILLLTYQSLRSLVDNLTPMDIHVTDLIQWEKSLFGGWIPSYYLQQNFHRIPGYQILTFICNVAYLIHFVVPLIVAMIIWNKKHNQYWYFIFGLLFLSYAGFITYYLFPAAPPWWATNYGYLPDQPVYLSTYFYYPTVVEVAGPNPVAAMPSLHMAYPTYIVLFITSLWPKKGGWLFFYPLLVGFSTVLLGHHYVIDLLAGVVYALISFGLIKSIEVWRTRKVVIPAIAVDE
jgi:membrane-associated phospholipid phosphatase